MPRKTLINQHFPRYQIKQEEKRKNEELKQKHFMQGMFLLIRLMVFFAIIGIVASIFGV